MLLIVDVCWLKEVSTLKKATILIKKHLLSPVSLWWLSCGANMKLTQVNRESQSSALSRLILRAEPHGNSKTSKKFYFLDLFSPANFLTHSQTLSTSLIVQPRPPAAAPSPLRVSAPIIQASFRIKSVSRETDYVAGQIKKHKNIKIKALISSHSHAGGRGGRHTNLKGVLSYLICLCVCHLDISL